MDKATVAIIGGGFSGTVAAIRLLTATRDGSPSLPFGSRVVLVEPGRAGEGLAYRAGPECWRLNVPAKRMSAFPERPGDFLEWAHARNPLVSGGDFLPRAWYGDYPAERLDFARRRSPRWLSFEQVRARAVGIDIDPQRIKEAQANAKAAKVTDRVRFVEGDLFEADIGEATVGASCRVPTMPREITFARLYGSKFDTACTRPLWSRKSAICVPPRRAARPRSTSRSATAHTRTHPSGTAVAVGCGSTSVIGAPPGSFRR